MSEPRAIVVAGMHRSGTSLVASLCADAGVDMGARLLGPGPGNPRGHYEDLDVLSERIRRAFSGR